MLIASAQMIEAQKNRATADRRIGFRPQISDRLAQILELAALAIKYAPPIHTYPVPECSSAEIVGVAVATIVWSSAEMKRLSWLCRQYRPEVIYYWGNVWKRTHRKGKHDGSNPPITARLVLICGRLV
jgi:hypothetical protein